MTFKICISTATRPCSEGGLDLRLGVGGELRHQGFVMLRVRWLDGHVDDVDGVPLHALWTGVERWHQHQHSNMLCWDTDRASTPVNHSTGPLVTLTTPALIYCALFFLSCISSFSSSIHTSIPPINQLDTKYQEGWLLGTSCVELHITWLKPSYHNTAWPCCCPHRRGWSTPPGIADFPWKTLRSWRWSHRYSCHFINTTNERKFSCAHYWCCH